MRLQARLQKLERALPPTPLEDPEFTRIQVALRTLPTEALEQLEGVLKAQMAGRPLTEQELETAQLFNVALAAVPMPINSCAQRRVADEDDAQEIGPARRAFRPGRRDAAGATLASTNSSRTAATGKV